MTLIEALKTDKPLRRKTKKVWVLESNDPFMPNSYATGWFDAEYFLSCVRLSKEDILANDWQVKKGKV